MAIDTEEMVKAQPMDGVVLVSQPGTYNLQSILKRLPSRLEGAIRYDRLTEHDKLPEHVIQTVPAQVMGAISANTPCITLVTGPMLTGSHQGRRVGACTDCRRYWKDYRAGVIDIEEIVAVNEELVPTVGVSKSYFIYFTLS